MPILTPPPTWVNGPVTAAMMNARVRDAISELQTGTARGIMFSGPSTARTSATSTDWIDIPGAVGTFSVDSPRTLQAIAQVSYIGVGGTGAQIMGIQALVNGQISVYTNIRIEQAGGTGAGIVNLAGVAIPVPVGTVDVKLQIRQTLKNTTTSADAQQSFTTLQIIDQGAS